jgi:hypothetical protein
MTLVEPPAPLLPGHLGDLARVAPGDSGDGLDGIDQADAAALKEDGLVRFARSEYTPDGKSIPDERRGLDKTQHGMVRVYEFGDISGAVAAFDYFRGDKAPTAADKVGDESAFDKEGVVFRSGVNVVREDINRGGSALMKGLTVGLPKTSGRRGLPPLLPTMLPPEAAGAKLDPASVRYALGPVAYKAMGGVLPPEMLGWDKSLETATASYSGKGGKGTLTLLMYPTPQIAGDRGRAVEQAVNAQLATLGTVKMRRVGPLVGVVSGSLSAEQAEALVQALHLQEIVTFDQKMPLEFHAEVRKTATLLQQIAIFTGVLIIAAIVIAVFLGGARAGIRVLRGKPAASEPEFLTIDLRDKPKAHFVPKGDTASDLDGPTD